MPKVLVVADFTTATSSLVAGFDCGSEPWAVFASRWITASPGQGVYRSMDRNTKVWLYINADDDTLVGFRSLGTTHWREYANAVSIIPQLGIHRQFRGQPTGPGERKYSHQLLDHLISEAKAQPPEYLVLTVDPGNDPARGLYRAFGFQELPERSPLGHVKMAVKVH